MKNKAFRFCVLAGILASACTVAEVEPQIDSTPVAAASFLTATMEGEHGTKTHLQDPVDGIYYPCWTADDALAVYVDALAKPDKYILKDGEGTPEGTFAGTLSGGRFVALYPYDDATPEGLKDNILTFNMPGEQVYAQNSFGEGAYPMLAVSEEKALSFLNMASVLKVSMTGDVAVRSITFTAADPSVSVSGKATVCADFASVPEMKMADGGSPSVTLDCSYVPLDSSEPVDFFIVIPPATYKGGFTLTVQTFSGVFEKTITSDVTFDRSQFRYIAPFECVPDGEIDLDHVPYNQIWYCTDYDGPYDPWSGSFDSAIISNTYENGKGVIVFDGPVTSIDGYAFATYNLTEIHLPDCVSHMGERAFAHTKIKEFRTPLNLNSVGDLVFIDCANLERIYGPLASSDEKAVILPDGTLAAYVYSLIGDVLTIPEGTVSIPDNMFRECEMSKLIVPDGVVSLGEYSFYNCTKLAELILPASLKSISNNAFYDCKAIERIEGDCALILDSHCLVSDGDMILFAGVGITDYTIPEGVVTLLSDVFQGNTTLRSLTFPSTFKNIWSGAFCGCDNLEYFYGPCATSDNHCIVLNDGILLAGVTGVLPADYAIPADSGIKSIFACVFEGIKTLEKLTIPDSVVETWDVAFYNLPNLNTLTLSASLSYMGDRSLENCPELKTIYMRSATPPYYNGGPLATDGLKIYVPAGTEELYKAASYWSTYADYIHGYNYTDLPSVDYYVSTDFSRNGVVTELQTATEGSGIDLVLMGDAFSDRQIADGTYAAAMNKMMEAFFSEEPYTSFRHLFNVYSVDVVSYSEGYEHPGQALGGSFGDGTRVGGNNALAMDYAQQIVGPERLDKTVIIVAMNSSKYAGTCYYTTYPEAGDYGQGNAVAYFPLGPSDEVLEQLVHHEAGGHGFAKLADEYAYEENGRMPEDAIESYRYMEPRGWWKNGDFTPDPDQVKWSHFLKDDRYAPEGLGVFEGAFTFWSGAYRPSEYSIMRYNTGGYNAPSREAIWYRIHKLAYGDAWEYDYEEFVAWDLANGRKAAQAPAKGPVRMYPPTHPPVFAWEKHQGYCKPSAPVSDAPVKGIGEMTHVGQAVPSNSSPHAPMLVNRK